jgi:hypothetical protein
VPTILFRIFANEVLSERQNVFAALAKRRQVDRYDVEPVEKVFAERAFIDGLSQIDIRGGDDAHVYLTAGRFAERREVALLYDAKQFRLRLHGYRPDLIKKNRAAIGYLEVPFLGRNRAGERAARVAE